MASTKSTLQNNMKYNLSNVKMFVENRSVAFWISLAIVVSVFLGLIIYEWYKVYRLWNKYIDCGACYIRFKNTISSGIDRRPTSHNLLVKPQDGYTYSMWLYVVDWYNSPSSGKWKNVYLRGPPIPRNARKKGCSISWDSIPRQQPGIWFMPKFNNIRVVVSTKVSSPAGCLSGEGADNSVTNIQQCGRTTTENTDVINILEYADLDDFPIGKWFQLLIVVNNQKVELYLNGELVTTKMFVGTYHSMCDTENGHFSLPTTGYNGRIMNFRYMPHTIPQQMIRVLYDYEKNLPSLQRKHPMNDLDNSYNVLDL